MTFSLGSGYHGMETEQLKYILEAALLAAGRPMSVEQLQNLFAGRERQPARQEIRAAIVELQSDYADRGISVLEVASGFRVQIRSSMTEWLEKLWEERPPRYSRALMETMAIIAYRQPVTRGEIEDIRGVAVSTNIMRTLQERSWVRVVGHRDLPGKPAMFGTTKEFLDYFGLKKLDDLPPLSEFKDLENLNVQLDLPSSDDADVVGPGVPQPLVRTAATDDDPQQPAEVTSIEVARSAASSNPAEAPESSSADDAEHEKSATVVPLKTS